MSDDELTPTATYDEVEAPPSAAAEAPEAIAAAEVVDELPGTDAEEAPPAGPAGPPPFAEPPPPESPKKWYVIKVASNREDSIKAAIERRVRIEGLEQYFGQIVIPVERYTEVKKVRETKNGEKITKEKRVVKERKKFPGYLMAEVEFTPEILILFRETSGVGDFVGATGPLKPPPPMTDREVRQMLGEQLGPEEKAKKDVVIKLDFEKGDKVRIREGMFANTEGEVKIITTPKEPGETPRVTVEVVVFGRPVPVELDYWQVDKV